MLNLTNIFWESKLYADYMWNTENPLILFYFNAIDTEDKHDTIKKLFSNYSLWDSTTGHYHELHFGVI